MSALKPVVFYNPRAESHILPLGLVHVGSMFGDRPVHVVDGRLEQAPLARVIELTRDAACLGVSVLTGLSILVLARTTHGSSSLARVERIA